MKRVLSLAMLVSALMTSAFGQSSNNALEIARARLKDAEAAATLTAEGRAQFNEDSQLGSAVEWKQYKQRADQFLAQGEFRQAIRTAAITLFLGKEKRVDTQAAFSLLLLSSAYLSAGDIENAKLYATQAKEHAVHPNFRQDLMSGANKLLGSVALRQGDYPQAIDLYGRSFSESLGANRFYGRAAQALAYAKAKQGDRATEILKRAETFVGVIPESDRAAATASLLRIRGVVALSEGKHDDAVKLYEAALATQGAGDDASYDKFWMLEGLGAARLAKGDAAGALKAYLEAITLAESVRGRFRGEEVKSGLFGEMQGVYDQAIKLHLAAGSVEAAWEINEKGRSRALLDMMRNRIQLAAGSSIFAEATGQAIKLTAFAALLKPGQAVLNYRVLDDKTFVWVTRQNGTVAATIAAGRKDLAQRVQQYRDAVVFQRTDARTLSNSLHEILLKPAKIENDASVVIIPHDALHYLPFHALSTGEGFLLQRSEVSYAPSANALARLIDRPQVKNGRLFAMGNPDLGDPKMALPGAQKEVEALAALFPQAETHFGKAATREKFFVGAPSAHTVHIAAHGTVDAVDPLYSKLHLAKDAKNSGTVDAKDIYSLKLDGAEMVVLSACETGLGKVSSGDEIWGFTRSFLSAGAPSLLVSLWPVADEATELLMTRFYSGLTKGAGRGKALRDAKLAVMSDPRFSAPYFWAGFNLIGDAR